MVAGHRGNASTSFQKHPYWPLTGQRVFPFANESSRVAALLYAQLVVRALLKRVATLADSRSQRLVTAHKFMFPHKNEGATWLPM
jgi:hypothetical protein